MRLAVGVVVALLSTACGDSGSGGAGGGSGDGCTDTQVEVAYIGGADERTECVAIPAVCAKTASCSVQECVSALYGLCAAPYNGVGCSDTSAPTIVSCNP